MQKIELLTDLGKFLSLSLPQLVQKAQVYQYMKFDPIPDHPNEGISGRSIINLWEHFRREVKGNWAKTNGEWYDVDGDADDRDDGHGVGHILILVDCIALDTRFCNITLLT